jgi:hypothetical protein
LTLRSRRVVLALGAAALLAIPDSAGAQRIHLVEVQAAEPFDASTNGAPPSTIGVFLASALVPGAGQFRMGQGRWVAYVGIEAWAWINWMDARNEANDLETQYRDLAWSVARRVGVGRRADREFEYYEAMGTYPASGSFDSDPALAGIQPEQDTSTFNGDVWELARLIFFPAGGDSIPPTEDARAAALDYYERNAIEPQFAWSWGSNQLEREHFRTLIRQSDEAARAGTTILGVILVNHVVSAIDALITARLRGPDGVPRIRLRGDARRSPHGPVPFLIVEVPVP